MKRKVFIPVLIFALFASLSVAFGCGSCDNGKNGGSSKVEKQLRLGKTSFALVVGEEEEIPVYVIGADKSEIIWRSSDDAVASVRAGNITAVGEGTAEISAKLGDITRTCDVYVTGSSAYPVIEVSENSVSLLEGKTFTVTASVSLNGAITDDTLLWVSDNESVATVSDGVITGVGAGSAEITVYTESGLASKTIKVTVVDGRHLFSLNVGSLYLKYAIVNPEDITEYDLSYTALLDNSADDGSVVWSSDDESVATVSASGKINKVGIGTTKVHGVYTFSDGVSRTAYVNVYVAKSVVNINVGDIGLEEENFEITSAMLKGFDLSTADVTFNGADIDAEITADKITFAVENFGVTDFVSGLITVTTEEAVFKCETFFVTRVIKTKQDLVDFFDFTERLTLNFNETVYNVSGYYSLGNDIDVGGDVLAGCNLPERAPGMSESQSGYTFADYGFIGTFDGRGYTIKNFKMESNNGFFGFVGRAGEVKNLSIKDAEINFINSSGLGLFSKAFSGVMSNVLIDMKGTGSGRFAGALSRRTTPYASLNNVVVRFDYQGTGNDIGVLGYENMKPSTENLYVITNLDNLVVTNAAHNTLATIYSLTDKNIRFTNLDEEAWNIPETDGMPYLKDADSLNVWLSATAANLYVTAVSADEKTSETVRLEVTDGGNKISTYSVSWVSGDNSVATVSDGVITSVGVGKTVVTATVTVGDKVRVFPIEVSVSYHYSDERLSLGDVDLSEGSVTFDIAELGYTAQPSMVKAEYEGTEYPATASGTNITVNLAGFTAYGEVTFDLIIDGTVYHADALAVTKILKTGADLLWFMDVSDRETEIGDDVAKSYVYGGYYVLGNDIDATGIVGENNMTVQSSTGHYRQSLANYGFEGTFDGRGYAITGLTVDGNNGNGIFGSVSRYGTVKNVEFKDCNFIINSGSGLGFVAFVIHGTLENVLLDVTSTGAGVWTGCVARRWGGTATVKNVVINYNYNGTGNSANMGVMGYEATLPATIENLIVKTNIANLFGANASLNSKATTFTTLTATDVDYSILPSDVWFKLSDMELPELRDPVQLKVSASPVSTEINLNDVITKTVTYTATFNGKTVTAAAEWSSADESVATVSDGVITAVGVGDTTVTLTVTFNGATATVTVNVHVTDEELKGEFNPSDGTVFGGDIEW